MPSPKQITETLWRERAAPVATPLPDFTVGCFDEQRALLEDTSSMLAVLCTRRAAKSYTAGLRLLRAAYKHPGCSCLYIALTRESAKKILWKDVLKVLNRKFKLGAKFNETELTMTLSNGSIVYLLGVNSTDEQKEKLLGQKYAEVAIDESASFTIDVTALVYGILKPAVADYRGTIGLYGTPGNLKKGLFFDITEGQNPREPGCWRKQGFSGHRWSTLQNPYMREEWLAEMAELIESNPFIEETPLFQQMYWGVWTVDTSKLVYRYEAGRNDIKELPRHDTGEWHYILAIDLGFADACSFTVEAYHDFDRTLYVLESTKKAGLDITGTSEYAEGIKKRFDIEATVIDGANKQAVEELNNRHGLDAMAADKRDKAEFIDMMNAEFIQGRIKLLEGVATDTLRDEYAGLIWDERALGKSPPKRVEHPSCENHATDGTYYGWRHAYQYLSVPLKPKLAPKSPEWYEAERQRQVDEQEARFEEQLAENKRQEMENRDMEQWQ